jgi:hypothetical protein
MKCLNGWLLDTNLGSVAATIATFFERADNAILGVAAEILGIPVASLPRNTRSEMSLPIRLGGMGVGDLVALADAAHAGAAGMAVGSTIRFLTVQDDRVRGASQDAVPMEPTMYGRLATAITTAVSRRHGTPTKARDQVNFVDVDGNDILQRRCGWY